MVLGSCMGKGGKGDGDAFGAPSADQSLWEKALAAAQADLGDVDPMMLAGLVANAQMSPAAPVAVDASELQARAESGARFVGVLTRFAQGLTHAFIQCEDVKSAMQRDVYIHANILAASGAEVGDAVEFGIHFNAKALPQASAPINIIEKGVGTTEEFRGSIKSFSQSTGYGFVDCPPLKESYGKDAYLYYEKAVGFYVGQEVIFSIKLNREQMPVVDAMRPAHAEEIEAWRAKGGGKGVEKGKEGKGNFSKGAGKDSGGGDFSGAGCSGSWGGDDGWAGGADDSMASLGKGKAKGADDIWAILAKAKGKGKAASTGKGDDAWGKGDDAWGKASMGKSMGFSKGAGKSQAKAATNPSGPYVGVVKSFAENTGYGFISCPETAAMYGGRDVFVLREVLGDNPVGSQVSFNCGENERGAPQATELCADESAGAAGVAGCAGVDQMLVKGFNDLVDENQQLRDRLERIEACLSGGPQGGKAAGGPAGGLAASLAAMGNVPPNKYQRMA